MSSSPPSPNSISSALHQLLANQESFKQTQAAFQQNLNNLTADVHGLRNRLGPPGFPLLEQPQLPNTSLKLDIPRFNGTNPLRWIFKITQFFEFHRTPEKQRLCIASFYMEGEALAWFQWMYFNNQILSWQAFLHSLETRFAPSIYEDPIGALFKLSQTSTVAANQAQFESLVNRIVGLQPQFYLSCFILGLKPAI